MSVVRCIIPGRVWMMTRRCLDRQYMLPPSALVKAIFLYCLARAAKKYGVRIIGFCCMSTHIHVIFYDPNGTAPAFYGHLHAMLAKCMNAELGRWETFWSGDGTDLVELVTPADVLRKMIYVQVNPVDAGAVRTWSAWPGARSSTSACLRKPLVCKIAGRFFNRKSNPAKIELQLHAPPQWDDRGGAKAWVRDLEEAVKEEEAKIHDRLAAQNWTYPTKRELRSQSTKKRSTSPEVRRGRRSTIAAIDPEERLAAIARLVAFRRAYAEARDRWLEGGDEEVEFPCGTYKMRNYPRVRVAPPPG